MKTHVIVIQLDISGHNIKNYFGAGTPEQNKFEKIIVIDFLSDDRTQS
jgi:hypothetical protein